MQLLARTAIASIGPVTSDTARARGLTVAAEATEYTTAGLLDALRALVLSPPSPGAFTVMTFPVQRPRRLRRNGAIRAMVRASLRPSSSSRSSSPPA